MLKNKGARAISIRGVFNKILYVYSFIKNKSFAYFVASVNCDHFTTLMMTGVARWTTKNKITSNLAMLEGYSSNLFVPPSPPTGLFLHEYD